MTIVVPPAFNGPPQSGNGGFSAGLFAGLLDAPAEVSLRRPVPLGAPLERAEDDGGLRISHAGEVVATVRPLDFTPVLPGGPPVSPDEARAATRRYRGEAEGPFARCFVCGRGREDTLAVFAGRVGDRRLVATPFTAEPGLAEDGAVRPEFVWAVLDCPTFAGAFVDGVGPLPLAYTASMTARILAPVPVGEELVVLGWPLRADGRKHWARSALTTARGELLAGAETLLIEPRPG